MSSSSALAMERRNSDSSNYGPVEVAKQFILDFARDLRMNSGQAIPLQPLHFRVNSNLTEEERDAVPQAVITLIEEGILEQRAGRYYLTATGRDALY